MEERDSTGEKIGHLIGDVIGWFWYLAILCGSYGVGAWAAHYFLGESHRDTVGILAAIATVWMMERQYAQHRYDRLTARLDGLYDRLPR